MVAYSFRFAELYDLFYADKPYAEEATFVHDCLQAYGNGGNQLLELACGTGNHAFELERLGYAITATDISGDMLVCARRKKEACASAIHLQQMGMQRIAFHDHSFDAVVCLFDSIGYLQTNEALVDMLAGVRKVLRSRGVFVFEFWHAAAMLRHFEPVRMRRWPQATGQIERISETSIDYARSLVTVKYTIYEPGLNGQYTCYRESHINRYFSVPEMESLLHQAGLASVRWYAGFQNDESIRSDTWHVVTVARTDEGRPS